MNVVRFNDVNVFYPRVEAYLMRHEAVHNLSLGLMGTLRHDPERFPEALFWLVEQDGAVQLVALRTNPGRALVLSLAQSPEAVTLLAQDIHASGVVLDGVNAPDDESNAFAQEWARLTGQTYRVNVPLRTFRLEKVNPVTGVPGHLRRATDADRDVLLGWEMGFRREAFPDDDHKMADVEISVDYRLHSELAGIYIWDDGGAVSYAGFGGPTPHGIRIGPVYTPPEQRQHGYASACVAGMSQLLLDGGRQFCFLFTDQRNPTSNHIYQVIGYEAVCDFTEYGFADI